MPSKLSFNLAVIPGVTDLFAAVDMPARLALARAHGFMGVEGPVPADLRLAQRQLSAEGMRYACLSFARGDPASGEFGLTGLPGRGRQFDSEFDRALDAAQALGCDLLHPLAGRVPAAASRDRYLRVYRDRLQRACERAAPRGVRLVVEPVCTARQPAYLLNTLEQARGLIDDGLPDLKVLVDMHHASRSAESTAQYARTYADSVAMLQVCAGTQRRQPAVEDAEFNATVQALKSRGWDGWYSAEYLPKGTLAESLAWTDVVRGPH